MYSIYFYLSFHILISNFKYQQIFSLIKIGYTTILDITFQLYC